MAGVSWERGSIAVRQQLQAGHEGKLALRDLKTDRARRVTHLPAVTLEALRQHQDRQRFEREQAQAWEDNDLIFCTEGRVKGNVGDRPLIHRNVYWLLQTTLQAAGLPHQRLYDL